LAGRAGEARNGSGKDAAQAALDPQVPEPSGAARMSLSLSFRIEWIEI
jgi:hypothetical protein